MQPPKKSLFSEVGHASKPGHRPHPPSSQDPSGSSGRRRNPKGLRPFTSFLDFLVEGQVLESLQTVVEEATERMATVKTEAGVPLVEVQDPEEEPRGGRRARARPSLSTLRRHRAGPGLCVGRPNNYPSRSSSVPDSRSSCTAADWPGCHSRDSDLGARGRLSPTANRPARPFRCPRVLACPFRPWARSPTACGGRTARAPLSAAFARAGLRTPGAEPAHVHLAMPRRLSGPRSLPGPGTTSLTILFLDDTFEAREPRRNPEPLVWAWRKGACYGMKITGGCEPTLPGPAKDLVVWVLEGLPRWPWW